MKKDKWLIPLVDAYFMQLPDMVLVNLTTGAEVRPDTEENASSEFRGLVYLHIGGKKHLLWSGKEWYRERTLDHAACSRSQAKALLEAWHNARNLIVSLFDGEEINANNGN